tara:strand:+ start:207 stop:632 length:426 start_codon:yes stop_codon:yes gene_type:complete
MDHGLWNSSRSRSNNDSIDDNGSTYPSSHHLVLIPPNSYDEMDFQVRTWRSLNGRNCDGRFVPDIAVEIRNDHRTVGCVEEPLDTEINIQLGAFTLKSRKVQVAHAFPQNILCSRVHIPFFKLICADVIYLSSVLPFVNLC